MKGAQHSDRYFPFHPRLQKPRFFINTSGFFIGGHSTPHPSYAPLFPLPASFPTLHVIGKNDTIVPHVETEFMTKMCLNKRVEWHMGGELQNAQDLRGCTLIGGPCRPFCAHESLLERFLQGLHRIVPPWWRRRGGHTSS